jgi:hypothetical protein
VFAVQYLSMAEPEKTGFVQVPCIAFSWIKSCGNMRLNFREVPHQLSLLMGGLLLFPCN